MPSSMSSRVKTCKWLTPILLSTPDRYELNAEQAERKSNSLEEGIFELGFKRGTEGRNGRSRKSIGFGFRSLHSVPNPTPTTF